MNKKEKYTIFLVQPPNQEMANPFCFNAKLLVFSLKIIFSIEHIQIFVWEEQHSKDHSGWFRVSLAKEATSPLSSAAINASALLCSKNVTSGEVNTQHPRDEHQGLFQDVRITVVIYVQPWFKNSSSKAQARTTGIWAVNGEKGSVFPLFIAASLNSCLNQVSSAEIILFGNYQNYSCQHLHVFFLVCFCLFQST